MAEKKHTNFWESDAGRHILTEYMLRRGTEVWPKTKTGKLTKRGREMALDWLIGVATGMQAAGSKGPVGAAFVASVRGTDEVLLPLYEAVFDKEKSDGS